MGPPTNPAERRTRLKHSGQFRFKLPVHGYKIQKRIFCGSFGMADHGLLSDIAAHFGWISSDNRIRGHVSRDHASRAHDGIFTDDHFGKDGAAGTDRSSLLHQRGFHFPVLLRLNVAVCGRGARDRNR